MENKKDMVTIDNKKKRVEFMASVCFQKTIHKAVSLQGIGVHSGLPVTLELHPLAANMGIIVERSDLKHDNQIFVSIENVVDTRGATTLANSAGVTISTVEHVMAALCACEITNVLIKISGPETPIMDGSSAPFIRLIQQAGIKELDALQTVISVTSPVELKDGNRFIRLEPSDTLSFELTQDFNDREGLKTQHCHMDIDETIFVHDVSKARSFGFYEDAQKLYAAGLAKGSSLENAVVIKDGEVMNPEGLHYDDEMVRHKVLDAMGDFFLCGHILRFKCSGYNIGHEFNNRIMRLLLSDPKAYTISTGADQAAYLPPEQMVSSVSRPQPTPSLSKPALSGLSLSPRLA